MVTPQRHLAAGDGYCYRYNEITREFTNYKQCVDDTCLWADTIEDNFRQTCEYLTHCSKNRIIFNKLKFQFCSKELKFSGIRGWFGLVEQVAYVFFKEDVMLPLQDLLKSKEPFKWTWVLQLAFKETQDTQSAMDGIKTFNTQKVT